MSMKISQFVISHCELNTNKFKNKTILYDAEHIKKDTSNGIKTWEGDNIDCLNPYYCELAPIYWIWKNVSNVDYVSIEHYRRIFLNSKYNIFFYRELSIKKINRILMRKKIILPRTHHFKKSLYDHYEENHYIEDLQMLKEVISNIYPSYIGDFDRIIYGHNSTLFNMCIMGKKEFDEYCDFAFKILDNVFKNIKEKLVERDDYQKRAIGFLAERLFNIWIAHNYSTKEIYHCSVGHLNQNCFVHNLKNFIFRILRKNYDLID